MGPVAIPPQSLRASPESPMPPREALYSLQCLEIFGGTGACRGCTSPEYHARHLGRGTA